MSMPSPTDMAQFSEAMRHKLQLNAHKDTPTRDKLPAIIAKLRREVVEFEEQVDEDRFNPNSLMELADIANFALLAFVALRAEGVQFGV